jgi:hypothetical protein
MSCAIYTEASIIEFTHLRGRPNAITWDEFLVQTYQTRLCGGNCTLSDPTDSATECRLWFRFSNTFFQMSGPGLALRFVKLVIGFALPLITYIFNSSITSGSFPTEWRISKIIPVAKIHRIHRNPRITNQYVYCLRCPRPWNFEH